MYLHQRSVPAEFLMRAAVKGGGVGGEGCAIFAHECFEKSAEGVGVFGCSFWVIPVVRDILVGYTLQSFAYKMKDDLDFIITSSTHLAQRLLHPTSLAIKN